MVMIQSECDDHALQRSLDTLSFLLLDKANRKVVQDLGGLSLLMSLYTRITDWSLLRMTLSCVCSLVRFDDRDKVRGTHKRARAHNMLVQERNHVGTGHAAPGTEAVAVWCVAAP